MTCFPQSLKPKSKVIVIVNVSLPLQNAYLGEETEEPEFQYVPETPLTGVAGVALSPGGGGAVGQALQAKWQKSPLVQSMLLLEESLESGAVVGQFEQVSLILLFAMCKILIHFYIS